MFGSAVVCCRSLFIGKWTLVVIMLSKITRSALSVPSNIAEGCERTSLKERQRFFAIAKGSIGEFATQADIGSEVGFVPKEVAARWQSEALQISRMLGALIKSLEQ